MKTKSITLALATVLTFGAASAFADHTETILGAAIGGATGAAVGRSIGGRGDVIIWSAIGGAAGAAVGHSLGHDDEREVFVRQRVRYEDDDDRYVVVRRPQRVQYVYEEPVRYCKIKHQKHGHGHHYRDWDDD